MIILYLFNTCSTVGIFSIKLFTIIIQIPLSSVTQKRMSFILSLFLPKLLPQGVFPCQCCLAC